MTNSEKKSHKSLLNKTLNCQKLVPAMTAPSHSLHSSVLGLGQKNIHRNKKTSCNRNKRLLS